MSEGVRVISDGSNPRVIVSSERVRAWLRSLADEAGFADRETSAFQLNVEVPFYAERHHGECPSLVIMVSNVPNSREEKRS